MVGVYLVIFWVQCLVGVCINTYNQILQRADLSITDIVLQIIVGSEEIGIGAATNSLIVVITAEGIMVLAAWVKKRQFAEGVEVGKKQGKAEERKRVNAKWRDLAEEFGIPEDRMPKDDESEDY
ncbi:MAG: hypothetical protein OXI16_08190 [Chloroflexota bacterium]|nr:hypothetical protein [Chloroflexota bacterium]